MFREWLRAQYHRGSIRAIAKTSRRWSVAIEFGTCRWGPIGGAAGSVTAGNGRFRKHAEERDPEGESSPVPRQEFAGHDAQGAGMMETWSSASLVVPEPDLPLEVLVVGLECASSRHESSSRFVSQYLMAQPRPAATRSAASLRPAASPSSARPPAPLPGKELLMLRRTRLGAVRPKRSSKAYPSDNSLSQSCR
jgi:hypothetical protein